LDKTGTLTKGEFEVSEICPISMTREQLLEYAALAECYSSHPISRSLRTAYGTEIDEARVGEIEEISGNGVSACVDGVRVLVGNKNWLKQAGIAVPEVKTSGSVVYVAVEGDYCGYILVMDTVKPSAHNAMKNLKQAGISKTVMLTGDVAAVAECVAGQLGIDEVHSGLLPTEKVAWVERLLDRKAGREKLIFVGDGINDAPVLARADIGIAMGALGSDAAIEAADVVLMDDDPMKIVTALQIAKKCMAIVYQNIVFSIGIKAGVMIFAALGIANMWAAIFADVGVMVLAVLNAMRVLLVNKEVKL
jgi:Cd2+/Zn2+-exporting ATPase